MRRIHVAVAGAAVLAVGAASAGAAADLKDFAGVWTIRSSTVGLIGRTVTFAADAVRGPPPIGCTKPAYKVETVGPDMIFEGQLAEPREYAKNPDPVASATKLAFSDPRHIVTLDAGCTEIQFHVVAPGTLVFGLDNRVYLMTRK